MSVAGALLQREISRDIASMRASQRAFLGASAVLFALAVVLTIVCWASMSAMGVMPMPGGWKISLVWTRMPGHSWIGDAASFMAMWGVMMVAMMQPALVQRLWLYRLSVVGTGERRPDRLTAAIVAAYYVAWTVAGLAVYLLGSGIAALEIRLPVLARAVPTAAGAIVLLAGALQFTRWKSRHLACCRESPSCDEASAADVRTAWRCGLHLGVHCISCCFNLMVILLTLGVMDLRAMALVTMAVTVERLAPDGERVSRATGVLALATGLVLLARAASL